VKLRLYWYSLIIQGVEDKSDVVETLKRKLENNNSNKKRDEVYIWLY
jgi:hypothetical protein